MFSARECDREHTVRRGRGQPADVGEQRVLRDEDGATGPVGRGLAHVQLGRGAGGEERARAVFGDLVAQFAPVDL